VRKGKLNISVFLSLVLPVTLMSTFPEFIQHYFWYSLFFIANLKVSLTN
jgi:hypothetical protein